MFLLVLVGSREVRRSLKRLDFALALPDGALVSHWPLRWRRFVVVPILSPPVSAPPQPAADLSAA